MIPARAAQVEATIRLFEWYCASVMICIAITLTIIPKASSAATLQVLMQEMSLLGGDHAARELVTVGFFLGGLARCFALYANGHWEVMGPRLRALGAAFGAFLWWQMSFAVVPQIDQLSSGSLAIAVFGPMGVGEIISCWRSGAHGRWQRR